MHEQPVVTTRGLTKDYGRIRALDRLDLEIEPGEVFGLVGPNGAGKTTTIRLLLDLIRPTSGTASVLGLDVRRASVEIHRRTGYLPGDLQLFDRISPADFFDWLARLRGRDDRAHAAELSERLGLHTGRRIADLSTGNRQKVALVQALMHRPELLILDEPTSGLDPLIRREFRTIVDEIRADGRTVFLSSHVLDEVEDVCDRVGMVVGGRLRRIDRMSDLRAQSRRRYRITFAGDVAAEPFRSLPGVASVDLVAPTASATTTMVLDVAGPPGELLTVAGRHEIVDLLSEPLSLEELFLEAYEGNGTRGGTLDGSRPATV